MNPHPMPKRVSLGATAAFLASLGMAVAVFWWATPAPRL
jgi:hypothetical protein